MTMREFSQLLGIDETVTWPLTRRDLSPEREVPVLGNVGQSAPRAARDADEWHPVSVLLGELWDAHVNLGANALRDLCRREKC